MEGQRICSACLKHAVKMCSYNCVYIGGEWAHPHTYTYVPAQRDGVLLNYSK